MLEDLERRCNAIEECYEFMLAYAAQGLAGDAGSTSGSQLREFLRRAVEALSGMAGAYTLAVAQQDLQPVEKYKAFLAVLERDATPARWSAAGTPE